MKNDPRHVHRYDGLEFYAGFAEVAGVGQRPVVRLTIHATKHDINGAHPPKALEELWMEPHEVDKLITDLQAALATHFPTRKRIFAEDDSEPSSGQAH